MSCQVGIASSPQRLGSSAGWDASKSFSGLQDCANRPRASMHRFLRISAGTCQSIASWTLMFTSLLTALVPIAGGSRASCSSERFRWLVAEVSPIPMLVELPQRLRNAAPAPTSCCVAGACRFGQPATFPGVCVVPWNVPRGDCGEQPAEVAQGRQRTASCASAGSVVQRSVAGSAAMSRS